MSKRGRAFDSVMSLLWEADNGPDHDPTPGPLRHISYSDAGKLAETLINRVTNIMLTDETSPSQSWREAWETEMVELPRGPERAAIIAQMYIGDEITSSLDRIAAAVEQRNRLEP